MNPKDKHDKKKRHDGKRLKKKYASTDDDSSVDSHGNIRGLIDYDQDSEDLAEMLTESSSEPSKIAPISGRTRSHKRPTRQGSEAESTSSDEPPRKKSFKKRTDRRESEKKSFKPTKPAVKSSTKPQKSGSRPSKPVLKKPSKAADRSSIIKKGIRRMTVQDDTEEDEELTESEEEEWDDEESDTEETQAEESDEDDSGETDEDEEEDDDQYTESSSHGSGDKRGNGGIILTFGGGPEHSTVPKRHNLKKESADVRKFVKLITTEPDEDTIDGQIDQFKALNTDQQAKLIETLEMRTKKPTGGGASPQGLMFKILTMELPLETKAMVLSKQTSLQTVDPGSSEYFKLRNWLEKLTSVPFGMYKEIPVKIADGPETCGAFMERARKCLDEAIFGQDEAKLQVLQFIGAKIANPDSRGLSLLLTGPPGIGKTSLIKNGIAKALNWPFQFISLGGDSDATTQTGHQLVQEGSHCGKIVNSLIGAKSMSLVLLFDELDKISTTNKGEEVANMLVHLTDPVQNGDFEDKYLSGIPIDLSKVMFAFSANQMDRIDRVLLDRMVMVHLEGQNKKEKTTIAENYLLPAALKEVGLTEKIAFAPEVMTQILDNQANEEKGVRELKRCMDQIAQKMNMLRMFNSKTLPFHIKDFQLPFTVKKEHIDLLLKKNGPKEDTSQLRMYT